MDERRANAILANWRAELVRAGVAPRTINRRLACIHSLLTAAWKLEVVSWPPAPRLWVREEAAPEIRGPSLATVREMIRLAGRKPNPAGVRDTAVLRLLFDVVLPIRDLVSLDVSDVKLTKAASVSVRGRRILIPDATQRALRAWLNARGDHAGPLFLSYSSRQTNYDGRLVVRSINRFVRDYGRAAGATIGSRELRQTALRLGRTPSAQGARTQVVADALGRPRRSRARSTEQRALSRKVKRG